MSHLDKSELNLEHRLNVAAKFPTLPTCHSLRFDSNRVLSATAIAVLVRYFFVTRPLGGERALTVKHKAHVSHLGNIPLAKVALEVCYAGEETIHGAGAGRVPCTKFRLERLGTTEHVAHTQYVRYVPTTQVPVESKR